MGDILEDIGTLLLTAMFGGVCAGIVAFCTTAGVLIAMHIF